MGSRLMYTLCAAKSTPTRFVVNVMWIIVQNVLPSTFVDKTGYEAQSMSHFLCDLNLHIWCCVRCIAGTVDLTGRVVISGLIEGCYRGW